MRLARGLSHQRAWTVVEVVAAIFGLVHPQCEGDDISHSFITEASSSAWEDPGLRGRELDHFPREVD